jgi:hypothetical protein
MGKSSGARPKKAVEKQVAALREQLNGLTNNEWQHAFSVYNQIAALCNHKGPMGGGARPRACTFCGYFGHTREFCDARKKAVCNEEKRVTLAIRTELECLRAATAAACAADPEWAQTCDELDARYRCAMEVGACKGCLRYTEGGWPCNECEECLKFEHYFNLPR